MTPNTSYTLTAWVKTAGAHNDGYLGARVLGNGPILGEVPFTQPLGSYTRLSVTFNSGANHSVELFAGMWAHGTDTWIQVDDVSLNRN